MSDYPRKTLRKSIPMPWVSREDTRQLTMMLRPEMRRLMEDLIKAGSSTHSAVQTGRYYRTDAILMSEAMRDSAQTQRGTLAFVLDPSYLQSQEQSYGLAPWGNAGPATGSAPYGGKSHVPPSMGGVHASLSVARPPSQSNGSGIQQLSQGLGQLEKLGGQGKSLFNTAKGGVGNLFGGSPQPSATTGGLTSPGNTPPAPHEAPPTTTPDPGAPAPMDASGGTMADAGGGGLGDIASAPDTSDMDLGDILSSSRGGLIHRDSGGSVPSFSQPTDSGQDDQSDSGDVPYDSGTGSSGLDIPDDKSNNKLAVAQPPQQQSGGGGFNPMSAIGPLLGIFGLAKGGRVGLAGGGDPSDVSLDDPSVFDQQSNVSGLNVPGRVQNALRADGTGSIHLGGDKPIAISDSTTDNVPSRNIQPPKSAPKQTKAGLNPDAPSPDAQPVQAVAPQGQSGHVTEPGEVLNQSNLGGVGDFLNSNQGLIVPLLHGLGTMASSNSRYLGSAILQGLGGAADSYENVQNEMQQRHGLQPVITQKQNDALQSDLFGLAELYWANWAPVFRSQTSRKLKSSGQIAVI